MRLSNDDAIEIIDELVEIFKPMVFVYYDTLPDNIENLARDIARFFFEKFDMKNHSVDFFDCAVHLIECYGFASSMQENL